jgi:hypothetical protein
VDIRKCESQWAYKQEMIRGDIPANIAIKYEENGRR